MPSANVVENIGFFLCLIRSKQTNAYFLSRAIGRLSDSWAAPSLSLCGRVESPRKLPLAANLQTTKPYLDAAGDPRCTYRTGRGEAIMKTNEQRAQQMPGGQLGPGRQFAWWATEGEVNMAMPQPTPAPVTIACTPQNVTVDLLRTAIIVIDMQNDFCTAGRLAGSHRRRLSSGSQADRTAAAPAAGAAQGRRAGDLGELGQPA